LQNRIRLWAIAAAIAAVAAATGGPAQASLIGKPKGLSQNIDVSPPIEEAQFIRGGRRYCWYWDGWHGPGWYWCGYHWRRGFGWGGPSGWHGWHRPAHRPRAHRPPGHRPPAVHRPGPRPPSANRPGGNRPGVNRPGGGRPGAGGPGGNRPGTGGRPAR
jgi:hypothetical protein